jgi:hypothetical protein
MPVDAFRRGDWETLKGAVSQMSAHRAHEVLRIIAERCGLRSPLDGLIASADDQLGLTIHGAIQRYRGWRVRGALVAEETAADAFHAYGLLLQEAMEKLDAALDLSPRDPLASGFRSTIAVEEDHEGKTAAIIRVQEADGVVAAQALGDVLTAWTMKWGASQDDMWTTFSRLYDPARIETYALVPQAHFEQQMWHRWFEHRPGSSLRAMGYYRSRGVRDALAAASDRVLDDPQDADAALLRFIDGWMARVFSDAGNRSRAREHFRRLGGYVETSAWSNGFLLSAETRFKFNRMRAGLMPRAR